MDALEQKNDKDFTQICARLMDCALQSIAKLDNEKSAQDFFTMVTGRFCPKAAHSLRSYSLTAAEVLARAPKKRPAKLW